MVGKIIVSRIFPTVFITGKCSSRSSPKNRINDKLTLSGNDTSTIRLLIAVSEIDKATLPLNKWVIRFVAAPPAQAVMIMKPTLNTGSRPEKPTSKKAIRGRIINWHRIPVNIARGYKITFLKSRLSQEIPMPIIITDNEAGRRKSEKIEVCTLIYFSIAKLIKRNFMHE